MSLTVVCGSCRQQVLIADAVGKARCPTCGTLCDVRVSAGPLPPVSPLDEDDSELYALPPDERKIPCPRCKYSLPSEAVVCANCGLNLDTGETLERLYPSWTSNGKPAFRIRCASASFSPWEDSP